MASRKPSKVKKLLVSQPRPENGKSPYFDLADRHRLNISFRQFIHVEDVPAKEFRKARININDFSGIILTSRNSIDHLFRICDELRVKLSQETKYFCTSEAIALYLQKYIQYRKRKVFYGNGSLQELKTILMKYKDTEKILLPCSESIAHLPEWMEENEFDYKQAVIYQTVSSDITDLNPSDFDMIVFYSPAGVKSLMKNFPKFRQNGTKIAAYGPSTCQAVEEAGLSLDLIAPVPEARSMTLAIEKYLENQN